MLGSPIILGCSEVDEYRASGQKGAWTGDAGGWGSSANSALPNPVIPFSVIYECATLRFSLRFTLYYSLPQRVSPPLEAAQADWAKNDSLLRHTTCSYLSCEL